MDKKANMKYWDAIDYVTESYVRRMLEFGFTQPENEDELMRATKEVVELVTEHLEKHFNANFPYVDENY